MKRLAHRVCGPAILVGLLIVSLLSGCRHSSDPSLAAADSLMEEHPDSALMMLNEYPSGTPTSKADSAYYALLLTHARYKNFIDETDDSLISSATDYFLDHDDKGKASRALFLQGMIRMNANRLGEAAVSFRKGLDIAREGKQYMWEGQCARGLFAIYGKIKNTSEQIRYAKAEYDAFAKGGFQDWTNNAKLNILRAYNNNEKYDSVLSNASDLFRIAEEAKDTLLMEEVLVLIGTSKYSLGDFQGALDSYFSAYCLNPSVIKPTHGYNIGVAAANIKNDSLPAEMKSFIETVSIRKETLPAFKVLANQGRFEEAFKGLERYKNLQDSVLRVIVQNNVAEWMESYENTISIIRQQEARIERILWAAGLLILVIIIGLLYFMYKKNLIQKNLERKQLEMSIEILKSDLESRISEIDNMSADIRKLSEKNQLMSTSLLDMLYEKYKKVNALCDSYFEGRAIESKKKKLEKEMGNLLKDFSDPIFLQEVAEHINRCLYGLYTSFVEDFPELNEDSKRLFMFLTLGFNNRSLCVILNVETANLYNRKSRLKKLIAGSDAKRKAEYIENLR